MSIKDYLHMMELEKEVNKLRAEKFMAEQRAKEAEAFINQVTIDLERSRLAASAVPTIYSNHPAIVTYDKRRSAYEMTVYLFQIFTGQRL